MFGIGSAIKQLNPRMKIIAAEGVGSTLSLWHAYLRAKGKGYVAEKMAIQKALSAYEKAGMIVSLKCYPQKNPEN